MSPVGQTQFSADLYGGTKDGLGLDDIRSLVVLAPPFREQERIVAYLDSQSAKLMKLVQAVRTAVDYLKGVPHRPDLRGGHRQDRRAGGGGSMNGEPSFIATDAIATDLTRIGGQQSYDKL